MIHIQFFFFLSWTSTFCKDGTRAVMGDTGLGRGFSLRENPESPSPLTFKNFRKSSKNKTLTRIKRWGHIIQGQYSNLIIKLRKHYHS